jgi:hypothetical protein
MVKHYSRYKTSILIEGIRKTKGNLRTKNGIRDLLNARKSEEGADCYFKVI